MFNVAVINIKDMRKGIAKIFVLIAIVTIAVSIIKSNNTMQNSNIDYVFLECLDICIPGIKEIELKKRETFSLGKILSAELPLSSYIIEEETETSSSAADNKKEQNKKDYSISIPENVTTEIVKTHVPESYTDVLGSVNIKNGTNIELTDDMILQEVAFRNPKKIFIYHTHTCESYTPSEAFPYEMSGNYRTTDLKYSVARVGTELEGYLKSQGFSVTHDTTYYDYPAYNGSYDRAYDSVKAQLGNTEDTEILFDIHRDAIGDSSYAPTVKIGEEYAAQMMFVIGSNGGGLDHPNWLQNLNFAIKVQKKANEKYPGLFKPIILRNSRYNQHLAKGACIIEVGATGNTLEQCNNSMKYLADVLKDVL